MVGHYSGTSEGPGFKSHCLQLNFNLEKGCGKNYMHYAIKYGCVELNLKKLYGIFACCVYKAECIGPFLMSSSDKVY